MANSGHPMARSKQHCQHPIIGSSSRTNHWLPGLSVLGRVHGEQKWTVEGCAVRDEVSETVGWDALMEDRCSTDPVIRILFGTKGTDALRLHADDYGPIP